MGFTLSAVGSHRKVEAGVGGWWWRGSHICIKTVALSVIMLGGVWSVLEELWGLFLGGSQSNKVNRQALELGITGRA